MSYKEIWETLSPLDCSEFVEKKNNLSYLSWANALAILMDHYPEATWEYTPDHWLNNGTVEVGCTITIGECTRHMTLPVMDYKNKSVSDPTSRDISDSRMRCWVKCVALFGLGLYLYRGHDLPESSTEPEAVARPLLSDDDRHEILGLCMQTTTNVDQFVEWLGYGKLVEVPAHEFARATQALNAKLAKMNNEYATEQAVTHQSMEGEAQ